MGLRDFLKKKDHDDDDHEAGRSASAAGRDAGPAPPFEFTFIRSDTHTHEVIHPPSDPASLHRGDDDQYLTARDNGGGSGGSLARRSLDVFKPRSRSVSEASTRSGSDAVPGGRKRLSQRLHLSRSPSSSSNVPQDLPEIVGGEEQQWETRATMLARENEKHRSRPASPVRDVTAGVRFGGGGGGNSDQDHTTSDKAVVSSKAIDADIQEAIRLHEEGKLEASTRLFGQLADPKGANNPLSQVLYGLALRHGWGCEPDTAAAVSFLSAAASNAATVESLALQAGLKRGGAAKGELVLAIFELANCFRHGWGIPKDPIAAKQYYETAANLGDTDAMNEAAWCYLEGFGCKKDKFAAAKYYRRAEENGNKTLGNSWIWKEKYDPGKGKK